MSQALYNKWRPKKWEQVIGQEHVVQTLQNAIRTDKIIHAYLFAGPRGTGKTTTARLLAKAVNCLDADRNERPCNKCDNCIAINEDHFLDLIEIDAASQNGVDDVRDLREKVNFSPNKGRYRVYIIDEVHMFSTPAFNALLKTLEEPPPHVIFILATTEIHKLPATVLSRCQRHEFRRLSMNDIVGQLQHIIQAEGISAEQEALALIARQSTGGMRDAISLLDQMASTGKEITLDLTQVVLGTATNQTVLDVVQAIREKKPDAGMRAIHVALNAGSDTRQLARQVVDYLRSLLLIKMGNAALADLAPALRTQADEQAKAFSHEELVRLVKVFNQAAQEPRGAWQPALGLELALAEAVIDFNRQAEKTGDKDVPPAQAVSIQKSPAPSGSGDSLKAKSGNQPIKNTESTQVKKDQGSQDILDLVRNAWKQILDDIKRTNPNLSGLVNSCQSFEFKDGVLVLGFASKLLLSKMEVPEQLEVTRSAIVKAIGREVPIRCAITSAKQSTPTNVKADGMVAAAIRHGGEIVDIQE